MTIELFTYILATLWVIYTILLFTKRKILPVNIYGALLVTSVLQPFLLFYEFPYYTLHIEQDLEVLIDRYLFLITFVLILMNRNKNYNDINKILKK